MKSELKRISSEEEFQGVYKLFNGEKTIEELKWLYTDPENSKSFNAYLAKNGNDEVIGVIGYQTSIFKQGKKEFIGVTGFDWKVAPNIKGLHGVLLIKKIFDHGNFFYSMGSTQVAMKFYDLLKFKKVNTYTKYFKILNLNEYNESLKKVSLKRRIGFLGLLWPTLRKSRSKRMLHKDFVFEKYENNFTSPVHYDKIFQKKITKNYIEWLLRCPSLDSYAFVIKKNDVYLGTCVLYIQNVNGINIGRIVHLPFLGYDIKNWVSALDKCLLFFKMKKCAAVTGIASHEMNHQGYKKTGFIGNRLTSRSIYVKDVDQKLKKIELGCWFLQFSEGDMPILGF
ncbi:hypothetical protein GQ41_3246 [Arenibacter algicola]|uniref:GNAT family N-acetyltransferase n=1 Tax=Arenibacter algicola TaxID=616991 RepID=A0ABY3AHR9_9FLAO